MDGAIEHWCLPLIFIYLMAVIILTFKKSATNTDNLLPFFYSFFCSFHWKSIPILPIISPIPSFIHLCSRQLV